MSDEFDGGSTVFTMEFDDLEMKISFEGMIHVRQITQCPTYSTRELPKTIDIINGFQCKNFSNLNKLWSLPGKYKL
jgi:hypothetical protein